MGKKVDKEDSGWTIGGMEQQDGVGRPWLWSPVTRKGSTLTHAPARGRQATGEGRRVTACAMLVAGGVAIGV